MLGWLSLVYSGGLENRFAYGQRGFKSFSQRYIRDDADYSLNGITVIGCPMWMHRIAVLTKDNFLKEVYTYDVYIKRQTT